MARSALVAPAHSPTAQARPRRRVGLGRQLARGKPNATIAATAIASTISGMSSVVTISWPHGRGVTGMFRASRGYVNASAVSAGARAYLSLHAPSNPVRPRRHSDRLHRADPRLGAARLHRIRRTGTDGRG